MSGLDDGAKAILVPDVIVGNRARIATMDQRALAAWAALKATEIDLAVRVNNRKPFYSFDERSWLRQTQIPPGQTSIWLARASSQNRHLAWAHARDLWGTVHYGDGTSEAPRGYVVTYVLGLAVFQVLSHRYPPNHGTPVHPVSNIAPAADNVLNQIWPVTKEVIYRPTQSFDEAGLISLTGRWEPFRPTPLPLI
jgi:hypothetical protein